jgi:cytochrome c peroxidase
VWLALSLFEAAGVRPYVTTVLLGPDGEIAGKTRKILVREEDELTRPAIPGPYREVLDAFDSDAFRVGIVAGDDLQSGVPRLAARGARVILVTAGRPTADSPVIRLAQSLADTTRVTIVVAGRCDGPPAAAAPGAIYRPGEAPVTAQCGDAAIAPPAASRAGEWTVPSELGLPRWIPLPAYASGTAAVADLGRRLFIDRGLSSTGAVACATCHQPARGFTNAAPRGAGVHGHRTSRNVPSLLNVAFRPLLQWDGYASSLENFAKYPLSNVYEMRFHYLDAVVAYVRAQPSYARDFAAAIGERAIEFDDVAHALATYQRTLVSGRSPFDRYVYGGETGAMPPAAVRGLALFTGAAGCASCHRIGRRDALLTDFAYHDLGVGYDAATGRYRDIGLAGISSDDHAGEFLTPSLRNVAMTGPYMHDGSLGTLEDVVAFYDRGGAAGRRGRALRPLHLSPRQRADLTAFLEALTGVSRYGDDGRRVDGARPPHTLGSLFTLRRTEAP